MFGLNSWITTGIILWVIGKIIKAAILEKIGFWLIIIGIVLMAAGFLGFSLPF